MPSPPVKLFFTTSKIWVFYSDALLGCIGYFFDWMFFVLLGYEKRPPVKKYTKKTKSSSWTGWYNRLQQFRKFAENLFTAMHYWVTSILFWPKLLEVEACFCVLCCCNWQPNSWSYFCTQILNYNKYPINIIYPLYL